MAVGSSSWRELCFSVICLAALASADSNSGGGWISGRATFYGDDGGATIDQGSCMYGYIDPNIGVGVDIAALSDRNPEYPNSCG